MNGMKIIVALTVVAAFLIIPQGVMAQRGGGGPQEPMGFFITSTGPGDGANLGGLDGADAHCQSLAAAAGAGDRTWRAYLSQTRPAGPSGQCQGPHRLRPLVQRQRATGRGKRRRSPRRRPARPEQHPQTHRTR